MSSILKHLKYIIFFLLTIQAFSQDFDQRTIQSGSKIILIEFASVETIELRTNNSSEEIEILSTNTGGQNTPQILDDGRIVHIVVSKDAYSLKGTDKNKYRAGQPLYPNYVISIPKGLDVKLLYDKGNLKATNFQGNLDVRLNTGDVMIDQFSGVVHIESFAGKINCNLTAARLDIVSNKGAISSSLQDRRLIKTQNSLKGIFNSTKNVLKINTIRAKVNLKSMSTQK